MLIKQTTSFLFFLIYYTDSLVASDTPARDQVDQIGRF